MGKNSPCEKRGTLSHFKKYRWKDLNKRTINGSQSVRLAKKNNSSYRNKQVELQLTKDEFYSFCDDNQQVIKSIYESGEVPSIGRVDSNGHYSLDNMRIIPLSQNIRRK